METLGDGRSSTPKHLLELARFMLGIQPIQEAIRVIALDCSIVFSGEVNWCFWLEINTTGIEKKKEERKTSYRIEREQTTS